MPFCERCQRNIPSTGMDEHRKRSDRHWFCYRHCVDFTSESELKEHYVQSRDHHYCVRCNEHFDANKWLLEHLEDVHNYCKSHRLIFPTYEGLKQHFVKNGEHHFCHHCDMHFSSDKDLLGHAEEYHDFVCQICVKIFPSRTSFEKHNVHSHHCCKPCDRVFASQANLHQHLASLLHQPRSVTCPARGCRRPFPCPSALLQHADSGTCPSAVSREVVLDMVAEWEDDGCITASAKHQSDRLLPSSAPRSTFFSSLSNRSKELLSLSYASSSTATSTASSLEWYATEHAWNGSAYECFLCHKRFRQLKTLNTHLAGVSSPHRTGNVMGHRCPNHACAAEFDALSELCQHVERGACGVQRFQVRSEAKGIMASLQSGMRAIALH